MKLVTLEDVSLEYPIFDASARSLRKRLVRAATGGELGSGADGQVVVQALSGISFDVSSGERIGLVGHNGAGKTSLLGVLSRIYHPTGGKVCITGSVASLIGLNLGADAESTGRENIVLRGAMLGLSRKEIAERMEEIIDFSELGDFIDMPVRTYSSGMSFRIAFAVATILRPDILLMDEWLSVGDNDFRRKAQKRLSEMVDETKVLVLATHSKGLLLRQCTRALWLEHGRIRLDATPDEVAEAYFEKASVVHGRPPVRRGLAAEIKDYLRGFWPGVRLSYVGWDKINGTAVAALVDLLERQGGFFRLPKPENEEERELARCLAAAWKIIMPSCVDAEAEEALFRLKAEHVAEILAELVLYQNGKRPLSFWINTLERAGDLPSIAAATRARVAARLAVLRKESADERATDPARLLPLNPLTLETVRRPLDEDMDDAGPAPGAMIVAHEDQGDILGESIVFRECSLAENMTVVINGRYFSATHDAAGWIRCPAKLRAAVAAGPACRAAFPVWYLDAPNDYLKFTQLIPSILLHTEFGEGAASRLYADLSDVTLAQLAVTASFFSRPVPTVSSLHELTDGNGSAAQGLLIRATHQYIARLRAGAEPGRWSEVVRSERKIYLAAANSPGNPGNAEAELRAQLIAAGFEILIAGAMSFAEEIQVLAGAQIVAGATGPHLTRMIFVSPECRFLELCVSGEPVPLYRQLAASCGIKSYHPLPRPDSAAAWAEWVRLTA